MSHQVVITINVDNAAFQDGAEADELNVILVNLARSILADGAVVDRDVTLFDVNGNNVGSAVRR